MKDILECSDPVMRGSMAAIQRAAEEARCIAIRTGTELIIMRDGGNLQPFARGDRQAATRRGVHL